MRIVMFCAFLVCGLFVSTDAAAFRNIDSINIDGLLLFQEKGECISRNDVRIFQVLEPNVALATEELEGIKQLDALNVLITNREGKAYYDKQLIKLPKNKCFRIIGTYQYESVGRRINTVPVVIID